MLNKNAKVFEPKSESNLKVIREYELMKKMYVEYEKYIKMYVLEDDSDVKWGDYVEEKFLIN